MDIFLTQALNREEIQFPKLGIDLNINPEAFHIFGLSVKWYGIMIATGLLLAMIYCFKRTKEYGIDENRLIDAVIAGVIGAVIGARTYYVLLYPDQFKSFKDVIAIWNGGIAIYGAVIGAFLIGGTTAKLRKLRVLPCIDLACMGFFIGQCLGRWGNFFNQEAFGANTTLPWGMTGGRIQSYLLSQQASLEAQGMTVDPYAPVHPTFLYESLWCLIGFLILHFFYKKRKFDGEVFCVYLSWYGLGRFFIEGLRTDSLYLGSFRASQMLALVSSIAGLAVIIAMRIRIKKKGAVELYRDSEESKKLLEAAMKEENDFQEQKKAKKEKKNSLSDDQHIIDDDEPSEDEKKVETDNEINDTEE